ncbi:MAG: hypothetical protein LBB63_03520 [Holosporaceae bacterium]|nr:hypothetical protein [Holosporaceae bacterium]
MKKIIDAIAISAMLAAFCGGESYATDQSTKISCAEIGSLLSLIGDGFGNPEIFVHVIGYHLRLSEDVLPSHECCYLTFELTSLLPQSNLQSSNVCDDSNLLDDPDGGEWQEVPSKRKERNSTNLDVLRAQYYALGSANWYIRSKKDVSSVSLFESYFESYKEECLNFLGKVTDTNRAEKIRKLLSLCVSNVTIEPSAIVAECHDLVYWGTQYLQKKMSFFLQDSSSVFSSSSGNYFFVPLLVSSSSSSYSMCYSLKIGCNLDMDRIVRTFFMAKLSYQDLVDIFVRIFPNTSTDTAPQMARSYYNDAVINHSLVVDLDHLYSEASFTLLTNNSLHKDLVLAEIARGHSLTLPSATQTPTSEQKNKKQNKKNKQITGAEISPKVVEEEENKKKENEEKRRLLAIKKLRRKVLECQVTDYEFQEVLALIAYLQNKDNCWELLKKSITTLTPLWDEIYEGASPHKVVTLSNELLSAQDINRRPDIEKLLKIFLKKSKFDCKEYSKNDASELMNELIDSILVGYLQLLKSHSVSKCSSSILKKLLQNVGNLYLLSIGCYGGNKSNSPPSFCSSYDDEIFSIPSFFSSSSKDRSVSPASSSSNYEKKIAVDNSSELENLIFSLSSSPSQKPKSNNKNKKSTSPPVFVGSLSTSVVKQLLSELEKKVLLSHMEILLSSVLCNYHSDESDACSISDSSLTSLESSSNVFGNSNISSSIDSCSSLTMSSLPALELKLFSVFHLLLLQLVAPMVRLSNGETILVDRICRYFQSLLLSGANNGAHNDYTKLIWLLRHIVSSDHEESSKAKAIAALLPKKESAIHSSSSSSASIYSEDNCKITYFKDNRKITEDELKNVVSSRCPLTVVIEIDCKLAANAKTRLLEAAYSVQTERSNNERRLTEIVADTLSPVAEKLLFLKGNFDGDLDGDFDGNLDNLQNRFVSSILNNDNKCLSNLHKMSLKMVRLSYNSISESFLFGKMSKDVLDQFIASTGIVKDLLVLYRNELDSLVSLMKSFGWLHSFNSNSAAKYLKWKKTIETAVNRACRLYGMIEVMFEKHPDLINLARYLIKDIVQEYRLQFNRTSIEDGREFFAAILEAGMAKTPTIITTTRTKVSKVKRLKDHTVDFSAIIYNYMKKSKELDEVVKEVLNFDVLEDVYAELLANKSTKEKNEFLNASEVNESSDTEEKDEKNESLSPSTDDDKDKSSDTKTVSKKKKRRKKKK